MEYVLILGKLYVIFRFVSCFGPSRPVIQESISSLENDIRVKLLLYLAIVCLTVFYI
ncbi:hypothetical protein YC2023_124288 [Brassica napus]